MHRLKRVTQPIGLCLLILFCFWPGLGLAIDDSDCLDCHGDDGLVRKTKGGGGMNQHESLYVDGAKFNLSVHHLNEIGCVDCHVDIEELNYDNDLPHAKNLAKVVCIDCHDEQGEASASSVHDKAHGTGRRIASCTSCHESHYVNYLSAASVAERENNFCAKCHKPKLVGHDWLPKQDEHFAFVECTVCHAPDVPRHIHLKFFDLVTNKFYEGNEILTILGITNDQFMPLVDSDKNGTISSIEFEALELMLKQKNVHATFHAELVAEMQPTVHQINSKDKATKDCQACHSATSTYFDAVTIVIPAEDGSAEHYNVDRNVLESFSLRNFYLYAGTRLKILDWIGLAMIGGGAAGILGHLTIRILTMGIRRRRKEEEAQNKQQ